MTPGKKRIPMDSISKEKKKKIFLSLLSVPTKWIIE
jgi:hypothetical protein